MGEGEGGGLTERMREKRERVQGRRPWIGEEGEGEVLDSCGEREGSGRGLEGEGGLAWRPSNEDLAELAFAFAWALAWACPSTVAAAAAVEPFEPGS